MTDDRQSIDVVRASRDGQQFHEAWAARIALELLSPDSTLSALAVEGFSFEDASAFSEEAQDIADLVRYRGGNSSLAIMRERSLMPCTQQSPSLIICRSMRTATTASIGAKSGKSNS